MEKEIIMEETIKEAKRISLEKELIETHTAFRKADNFLRKGYDFHIKALTAELKSLSVQKASEVKG